jgi:alanine racemase
MNPAGYLLSEMAEMMGAQAELSADGRITHLLIDSRKYRRGNHFIFFALRGDSNDGHRYIDELYRQGLRNFVVEEKPKNGSYPEANWLRVDHTLLALQRLSGAHRRHFSYPVWAITGSNGKTIVKEWLFQLLGQDMRIVRSPRSYNSQVGVPLSVWLMDATHDLALIECGISRKGEMDHLRDIVQPDVGIFTNIGPAHQENFRDYREKAFEKLRLFSRCPKLYHGADHEVIAEVVGKHYHGKAMTWGEAENADLKIIRLIESETGGVLIEGEYENRAVEISIPFSDRASVENACLCWLILLDLGIPPREISRRTSLLAPVAMRLEKRAGINNCTVINDAYNSDLASLEIALDFQVNQSKALRRVVILSDLLQTGEEPAMLYLKVADMLRLKEIEMLIGIGEAISAHSDLFEGLEARFFPETESFLADFNEDAFRDMSILVKGSRIFRFERIVRRLELRTHETVLEVNLNLMLENFNYLRSLLHPNTKIMAMVKAFAYGSGTHEVASELEYAGVDYLAVAFVDEGIWLRESGIRIPILVLNPETSAYDAMIRSGLEPQIYGFRNLKEFLKVLDGYPDLRPYPVHIKINTGMNRLGFDLNGIPELAEKLIQLREIITPKTVFSHLAGSDTERFDDLTDRQIGRFDEACTLLSDSGLKGFDRHILNSNGILRHGEAQMELVRMGLALYGLSSNREFRDRLKPVSKLYTVISQIREVPAGEGVGYSPKERLKENKKIGVIAMGYADGLPRLLGNGNGGVSVNGKHAPFIGNICMDMAMIDLTEIPCNEGDRVEVFGEVISIYELAKQLNTIPYEVLTNISQRVKRVFFKE